MSNSPFDNPYAPVASGSQGGGDPKILKEIKSQAITALVVGIVSFFCCGIVLAPFAIYRGNKAKALIDQTGVGREHRGMAQAGFIVGIVSLALNVIVIAFYVIAIVFGAVAQSQRNF